MDEDKGLWKGGKEMEQRTEQGAKDREPRVLLFRRLFQIPTAVYRSNVIPGSPGRGPH